MHRLSSGVLIALSFGIWDARQVVPAHGADNAAAVAQIETQTEQIRGLTHRSPVKFAFKTDRQFNALLTGSEHRDSPAAEVELGQRESVLLGWIGPKDDYRKIVFQGLTSEVIGFYDPQAKELYVRSNNGEALGIRRDVIAHEYTHALQDQRFNLRKLQPDQYKLRYRNSDMTEARHSLTEGDAVLTQILFVSHHYSRADQAKWLKLQSQKQKGPPVPKTIDRSFQFPYDTGVSYVIALYKSGGFKAIDAAYHRLPGSTYEIMHPDAYMRGWKPAAVTLHGVSGMSGWKQVDDDVMGAFGYQLMLWQYLPRATASQVTDGYRGDRYIFLENGKQNAARFESEWNSTASAGRARDTLVLALRHRYPTARISGTSPELVVAKDQTVAFQLHGTHLTMTYAPTSALALKLLKARTT